MSNPATLSIHIDGAARGNPGPAAFAYVIERDGAPAVEASGCLGSVTNNVAEYNGLVHALERAAELGGRRLLIHSDSELLVKQMNGEYRVKHPDLLPLYQQAKDLVRRFDLVTIRHIPRAQNSHADRLCNEALDGANRAARPPAAKSTRPAADTRVEAARADAVRCLADAAAAWARGGSGGPAPELVWDQLWSILEEHGVVAGHKAR